MEPPCGLFTVISSCICCFTDNIQFTKQHWRHKLYQFFGRQCSETKLSFISLFFFNLLRLFFLSVLFIAHQFSSQFYMPLAASSYFLASRILTSQASQQCVNNIPCSFISQHDFFWVMKCASASCISFSPSIFKWFQLQP